MREGSTTRKDNLTPDPGNLCPAKLTGRIFDVIVEDGKTSAFHNYLFTIWTIGIFSRRARNIANVNIFYPCFHCDLPCFFEDVKRCIRKIFQLIQREEPAERQWRFLKA